jgi:hypothetical protein
MNQSNDKQPGKQPAGSQIEGEGSYSGAQQYDEATRQFVKQGKVEQAARDAAPKSPQEAEELDQAEAEGRSHAKEEDPALSGKTSPAGGRGQQG